MGAVTGQSVGIDISEDFLDVHLHPAGVPREDVQAGDDGVHAEAAGLRNTLVARGQVWDRARAT
ncbi:hypothetical protein [Tautonia rosea]|uniref:hypothetical protein n=1 Tax=Tautonia rosea TaxID=2728037 RepID=UPI0014746AD6|nr:hypothetical protein [Tautonia rosea]